MQKVIEVKDLVNTHAVQGTSFSVEKGEIFGILPHKLTSNSKQATILV